MKMIPWPVWAFAGLLADVLVSPHLEAGGIRPEFCVGMLVLAWVYRVPGPDLLVGAFVLGLCRDLLSVGPLGLHALTFMTLAFAAGAVRRFWFTDQIHSLLTAIAGAVILQVWLSGLLTSVLGPSPGAWRVLVYGPVSGLLTAAWLVLPPRLCQQGVKWFRAGSKRLAWS